ncbi:hypothetical protein SLA2020_527800 [Shorea laevis]
MISQLSEHHLKLHISHYPLNELLQDLKFLGELLFLMLESGCLPAPVAMGISVKLILAEKHPLWISEELQLPLLLWLG